MKISLKQARRVEREIGTELEINTHGRGFGQMSVSIYEDLADKVAVSQAQMVDGFQKVVDLNRIRFAIRKAIESENENGGLNKLMNREAELKAMAKVLTTLMTAELTEDELKIAIARHATAKVANEKGTVVQSRFGDATDAIVLGATLRTETLKYFREQAKLIQRELLTVVDKLSALNAAREIEVSESDVKALEAAGIIV